jgi:hypothetical protein
MIRSPEAPVPEKLWMAGGGTAGFAVAATGPRRVGLGDQAWALDCGLFWFNHPGQTSAIKPQSGVHVHLF